MSNCEAYPRPKIRTRRGSNSSLPPYRALWGENVLYKPQGILDEVKRYTREPNHLQRRFKRDFVSVYQDWMGMETPNDAGELDDLRDDLQFVMEALDEFFFYGTLTGDWYEQGKKPVKELKIEGNIFCKGHVGHNTFLRTEGKKFPRGVADYIHGQTIIYIDAFENGSPRTVKSIFETLVHEMAHAIFQSFLRWGFGSYNTSDPAVLGRHGHGLVWVGMAEHMRDTIRSWDAVLKNFYPEDLAWMHNWKP